MTDPNEEKVVETGLVSNVLSVVNSLLEVLDCSFGNGSYNGLRTLYLIESLIKSSFSLPCGVGIQ